MRIHWDASKLRLTDIEAGELLSQDGAAVTQQKEISGGPSGDATVNLVRGAGAGGISGAGTLATLNFTALAPGSSTITIVQAGVTNAQGTTTPAAPGEATVTVQ